MISPEFVRAAQYVRMSTEHQRYSIEGQTLENAAYATERGMRIVRTYVDSGVSGLSMKGREGLKALIADVVNGQGGYDVILVYDVSRWGRFQDPDQAAHYEFLCREAGVAVEYTSEPFENDGSLTTTIVKHLKRAMAAEYSRELSVKVHRAQHELARQGYWRGAPAVYGYRRCELNLDGSPSRVLQSGEWKARQGRRIKLVLGPVEEVETVRRIFKEFVVHGRSMKSIAERLNAEGIPAARHRRWDQHNLARLLRNESYSGVLVAERFRSRLRRSAPTAPQEWIRVPGGCPAIVSEGLFELARRNLDHLPHRPTDETLLDQLRRLWSEHGTLSARLISDDPTVYSPTVFQQRFGGLLGAYRRIGYSPSRQQLAAAAARERQAVPGSPGPRSRISPAQAVIRLRALLLREGRLSAELIDRAPELPTTVTLRKWFGGMSGVYMATGYFPDPAHLRHWPGGSGQKKLQRTRGQQQAHEQQGRRDTPA